MTVAEYMQRRYDEFKTRSQIVEDARQTLAWFKAGLIAEIRKELLLQPLYSVEHAFQVALDIEEYLSYPNTNKFSSQAGETAFRRFTDTNKGT